MGYAPGRTIGFTTTPFKPASSDQRANLLSHESTQPWFSAERVAADARVQSRYISKGRAGQMEPQRLALDIYGNEVVFGNSSIVGRQPLRMSGADGDHKADVIPIREGIDVSDEGTFERLVKLLQSDDDIEERERAAQKLGELGDPRALDALFEASDYGEDYPSEAIIRVIGTFGEPAFDYFIDCLSSDNPDKQLAAAWALGEKPDVRAIEPLIENLPSLYTDDGIGLFRGDPYYYNYGVEALAKIYKATGLREDIRDTVIEALIKHMHFYFGIFGYGDGYYVDYIMQAAAELKEIDPGEPGWEGKSKLVEKSLVEGLALIKSWDDVSEKSRQRLFAMLEEYGYVDAIIPFMFHPHPLVRGTSQEALISTSDDRRDSFIMRHFKDETAEKRASAALFIGQFVKQEEKEEASLELLRMLTDEKPEVRIAAAIALGDLGKLGTKLPLLKLAGEDPNPGVRQAALMALQKIQSANG